MQDAHPLLQMPQGRRRHLVLALDSLVLGFRIKALLLYPRHVQHVRVGKHRLEVVRLNDSVAYPAEVVLNGRGRLLMYSTSTLL